MHVRFLELSAYGFGGATRTVANQAGALAAAGHDVEVISLYERDKPPAFPLAPGVRLTTLVRSKERVHAWYGRAYPHERWPSRLVPPDETRFQCYSELTDARLVGAIRAMRDGVLVTTRPSFAFVAARYAPDDLVVVAQDHMHLASRRPGVHAEMRRLYGRIDAAAVLTEADRIAYHRILDLPGLRVERVPNPTPVDGVARSTLTNPVAVAAGRLTRQKAFGRLIRAWRRVARHHPDWELRIFGRGVQENDLKEQVRAAGLEHQVRLPGTTTRLDQELAEASMFLLSSRFEGFPMVVLEAMSHGLPVVAFDCPTGPAEMITPGHDGLLIPPGDVPAFAKATRRMITDVDLRQRLGTQAAQSVRRFGTGPVTRQWEELFTELVERRTGAGRSGRRPVGTATATAGTPRT